MRRQVGFYLPAHQEAVDRTGVAAGATRQGHCRRPAALRFRGRGREASTTILDSAGDATQREGPDLAGGLSAISARRRQLPSRSVHRHGRGMSPFALKLMQQNQKDYVVYQFFDVVVNDPWRMFQGDPFRAYTPLGWTKIVKHAAAEGQAQRQATQNVERFAAKPRGGRVAGRHVGTLRQLKQRLALDDRVVVGEGVKGLDEQAAVAGFEVDVAQCPQGDSAAGIEFVHHALPLPLARQFLLKVPKHLGLGGFELKAHLVADPAAALHVVGTLALRP